MTVREVVAGAMCAAVLGAIGCSGGGSKSNTGGGGGGGGGAGGGATTTAVASMTLTDATKVPLPSASVSLSPSGAGGVVSAAVVATGTTNTTGDVTLSGALAGGTYVLAISKSGVAVSLIVTVDAANKISSLKIITPLSYDAGTSAWVDVSGTALLASISGVVRNAAGAPIAGAQVSLSGGELTNGAVATTTTNANGEYQLLVNVNQDLAAAMSAAKLIFSAPGYYPSVKSGVLVQDGTVLTGQNVSLTAGATTALWRETFEADSPTAAGWTAARVDTSGTASADDNVENGWHLHTAGLNVTNLALPGGSVTLAPGDTSAGVVPDPAAGTRCAWYGSRFDGNFIGTTDGYGNLDGGTSATSNAGVFTSPVIDLTGVPLSQPVSVSFMTWWEIEAVNPNASGYDVMTIQWKAEADPAWTSLARLNPLSDPQDAVDRSPLPYTNTGYNSPPAWAMQEPIPLAGAQGKRIQLRFAFETVDELYNGFRGWLIDDVVVLPTAGTFPTLQGVATVTGVDATATTSPRAKRSR